MVFELIEKLVQFMNVSLNMRYAWILFFVIPAFFIFWYLVRSEFIKLQEEEIVKQNRLLLQKVVIVSRTIIFFFLLLALAAYYVETEREIQGDVFLKILVDNSSSMSLLDSFPQSGIDVLKEKTDVQVITIGEKEESALGDDILNHLSKNDNILLVTDGQATKGTALGDVILYAANLNSTISALKLPAVKDDISVFIQGPEKTTEDVDNIFTIFLNRVGKIKNVPLKVSVDGQVVYDQETSLDRVEINKKFNKGFHRVSAEINIVDEFKQNNAVYKSVQVVPQPQVLFISKKDKSPLKTLFEQVVKVKEISYVPDKAQLKKLLNDAYAVVVNDIHSKDLNPQVDAFLEYLRDGNGMLVFGGYNSYGDGLYRASPFEALIMPVQVGKAGRKESDMNIVIVIDISGSTGAKFQSGVSAVDVEKALTINVLKNIRPNVKLAVVAFNFQAYLVSELSVLLSKTEIEDKISRLKDFGSTAISQGILKAVQLLETSPGSKHIILISDGRDTYENIAVAYEAAKKAANIGAKMYTVGVGEKTEELAMMRLAEITNGVYFKADEVSKLKILFGDLEEDKTKTPKLTLLNTNHFITQELGEISASIHGFNDVVPKTTARMLVTTNKGDPLFAVWRVGLGRVGAFAFDDGSVWSGELMSKQNSKLLIRSLNWAVGEPDRKREEGMDIKDTRIGKPTLLTIKSKQQPVSPDHTFYKTDDETYQTSVVPQALGFQEVLTASFASNYPLEYQTMGMNPELKSLAGATGGLMFEPSDLQGIFDFVKTRSKRTVVIKEVLRWPFILIAMVLFLIEIFIRRYLRSE